MLASRFEDLRMMENETISDFNSKLCDITNEAFAPGEKYLDIKLVRKTLRSLPERFAYKVTAIEEAQDVSTMKLDELIGFLQTFELNLKQNKKDKCIALRVEEQDDKGNTDVDESFVLLIKKFAMFLNERIRKKNSHKSRKHASAIGSKKQHIE